MILICDANRAIFQNCVQPRISPHKLASAPVLPPMRSRSGSKYAFENQHMSNCQHVGRLHRTNLGWKVVTQHVLITSLLPVKSIWGWGTRRMGYTMNFTMNSSPQFASSWNCQAKKQGQPQNESQNKWQLLSYLTHFQVHMLMIHLQWCMQLEHVTCGCSRDSGWDTLLARNACSYIEKHLSTAVMSASSILLVYLSSYPNPTSHPSSKTHMFEDSTRAEVIAVDCPTVFCSCCYRRFMANTSEMNKWSSVSRNDKIQKLREAKGPTLSQNWYHAHQFTLMINWTLFQCQTPHDDLIGLWWSFEAGNVFESKLSVSARNGEQSFWIWSPHNGSDLAKIHPHRYRCKMEAHGQLQLGGSPHFMRIKPMVGDEVTWYLTTLLDRFGFLPLFGVFVHPVGRTKSDESLIPMWAAPAAEWCFECKKWHFY